MRKKVKLGVSVFFALLILATMCLAIPIIIDTMTYDDDLKGLVGYMGIFMVLFLGIAVLMEIDLCHIVRYSLSEKEIKKTYKTVFNISELIMILILLVFVVCVILQDIITVNKTFLDIVGIAATPVFFIYPIVKVVHLIMYAVKEQQ